MTEKQEPTTLMSPSLAEAWSKCAVDNGGRVTPDSLLPYLVSHGFYVLSKGRTVALENLRKASLGMQNGRLSNAIMSVLYFGLGPDAMQEAQHAIDTTQKPIPRCGDHVLHRPSGEEWVVAWAEGHDLAPCGWSNVIARVSDCTIVKSATDDEHMRLVLNVIHCGDSRAARCKRLYLPTDTHGH